MTAKEEFLTLLQRHHVKPCCPIASESTAEIMHYILLNAATCWFLTPELSSADGVFQLLH